MKKSAYTLKKPASFIERPGFFHACQGEEKKLYLITSIPFELLSQTDQNMFSKGVTKKTKAELDEFLENFDS